MGLRDLFKKKDKQPKEVTLNEVTTLATTFAKQFYTNAKAKVVETVKTTVAEKGPTVIAAGLAAREVAKEAVAKVSEAALDKGVETAVRAIRKIKGAATTLKNEAMK